MARELHDEMGPLLFAKLQFAREDERTIVRCSLPRFLRTQTFAGPKREQNRRFIGHSSRAA